MLFIVLPITKYGNNRLDEAATGVINRNVKQPKHNFNSQLSKSNCKKSYSYNLLSNRMNTSHMFRANHRKFNINIINLL